MKAALKINFDTSPSVKSVGSVVGVRGPIVHARLPRAGLGELCYITTHLGEEIASQVVSFEEHYVALAPYSDIAGLAPGAKVTNTHSRPRIMLPQPLTGRVLNALGQDLCSKSEGPPLEIELDSPPPSPLTRKPINTILPTGVTVIDTLCTIGEGQRVGLFAGPGVGKSTLLGMIARNASVDVNVIALVGERGREVRDFIEEALGAEGLKRSVVVVSTSDEAPIRRVMAVMSATAIAEHFRSQGKRVLLLVDSLTRAARAMRDVGLAVGEMPVRQGFTPSVYTQLPKLLERTGNDQYGSITAIYAVLSHADSESDPLAEEIKSLLDGHLVLNPELAQAGQHPAIDPLNSISRLFSKLHDSHYQNSAKSIRRMLARLKRDRDVLLLGGTPDEELARFLELEPTLRSLLTQRSDERRNHLDAIKEINQLALKITG